MKFPVPTRRVAASVAAPVVAAAFAFALAGSVHAASPSAVPAVAPSGSSSASAPAQRSRMKTCNAAAHDKHGDERKAFMKQCLSKKGAASAAS
jgi:hypothetical protein